MDRKACSLGSTMTRKRSTAVALEYGCNGLVATVGHMPRIAICRRCLCSTDYVLLWLEQCYKAVINYWYLRGVTVSGNAKSSRNMMAEIPHEEAESLALVATS